MTWEVRTIPKCERPDHLDLPRVTNVLNMLSKPDLDSAIARLGRAEINKRRDKAGEAGTAVHNAIEMYLMSGGQASVRFDDNERQAKHDGAIRWIEKRQPEIVYIELELCDHDTGYRGTTDCLAYVADEQTGVMQWELWDWKTNKVFNETMGVQLRAYANRLEALLGIEIAKTIIVQLNTTTKRGYSPREFNEPFWVFRHLLQLHSWRKAKEPVKQKVKMVDGILTIEA